MYSGPPETTELDLKQNTRLPRALHAPATATGRHFLPAHPALLSVVRCLAPSVSTAFPLTPLS